MSWPSIHGVSDLFQGRDSAFDAGAQRSGPQLGKCNLHVSWAFSVCLHVSLSVALSFFSHPTPDLSPFLSDLSCLSGLFGLFFCLSLSLFLSPLDFILIAGVPGFPAHGGSAPDSRGRCDERRSQDAPVHDEIRESPRGASGVPSRVRSPRRDSINCSCALIEVVKKLG